MTEDYMLTSVEEEVSGQSQLKPKVNHLVDHDGDELFAWPWKGIVTNLPVTLTDGKYVGKSGSSLRVELTKKGFNPTRVIPLWNFHGHSGSAIVEFKTDMTGFYNAMSFEKAYEADHHGKKDWKPNNNNNNDSDDNNNDDDDDDYGIYGWVARADDYMCNDIIGEHLRKTTDLKTFCDIVEDENHKASKLKSVLTNVIEVKKRQKEEIESKYMETESALSKLIAERDEIHRFHNAEIKKIELGQQEHLRKILNDHEKAKMGLESEKKKLELQHEELQKREVLNENERKRLAEEIQENAARNSSLKMASNEQHKADVNVIKLADDHKREKEKLHEKIISLEKQLDAKQAAELERERLKGQLNVMKHLGENDLEVLKNIEDIHNKLKEKEEELDDLESLNNVLILQERKSNVELLDLRKALIEGFTELPKVEGIGVKRMGDLDSKPFYNAMKKKYNETEAEDKASELCSLWQEYVKESTWHPFKIITVNGKQQELIDESDKRLKGVKREVGEEVYKAVTSALREINEYNASGGYVVTELWNFNEGRKASSKEGASCLLKMWEDALKKRRNG